MNGNGFAVTWFIVGVSICAVGCLAIGAPVEVGPVLDATSTTASTRLIGALLLGWGLLLGFAGTATWAWLRHGLAGNFGLVLLLYAVMHTGDAIDDGSSASSMRAGFAGLLGLLHLGFAISRPIRADPLIGVASVSQLSFSLGSLWRLQGVVLALVAIGGGLASPYGIELLARSSVYLPAIAEFIQLSRQHADVGMLLGGAPAFFLFGFGLVAWFASWAQNAASWARFAFVFGVLLPLVAVMLLTSGVADPLLTGVAVLFLVFGVFNWFAFLNPNWIEQMVDRIREHLALLFFVQMVLYAGGAYLWWFEPAKMLMAVGSIAPDCAENVAEGRLLGIGIVKLIGPMAFGLICFAWMALMHRSHQIRRMIAQGLWAWLLIWIAVFWYNLSGHFGQTENRFNVASIGVGVPLMLVFLWLTPVAVFPDRQIEEKLAKGVADTKPKYLWSVWVIQGLYLLGVGSVLLLFAEDASRWLIDTEHRPSSIVQLGESKDCSALGSTSSVFVFEADQVRISSAYFIAMGVFSLGATRLSKPFEWKGMITAFLVWQIAFLMTFPFVYVGWFFSMAVPANVVMIALFVTAQLVLRTTHVPIDDLGLTDVPEGVIGQDQPAALPMGLQTLWTRQRASHLVGIGVAGSFQVTADNDEVPVNVWLERMRDGKVPVVMRFANLTHTDDAALDVRGAAISIRPEADACFDMVFNTGSFSAPRNVIEFAQYVISKSLPKWVIKRALEANRLGHEGAVAGLRRAPESFMKLLYHGQIVRIWLGSVVPPKDAAHQIAPWLVRYRLVPRALGDQAPFSESGLPDDTDTSAVWERARRAEETRPTDYLREELRSQIASETPVEIRLQAQFRFDRFPGASGVSLLDWYDPSVDWDERVCPWCDIGTITLWRVLSYEETERLWFNPGNAPLDMGTPRASGMRDVRSLGDSEVRVMTLLQLFRGKLTGVLGLPANTSANRSKEERSHGPE